MGRPKKENTVFIVILIVAVAVFIASWATGSVVSPEFAAMPQTCPTSFTIPSNAQYFSTTGATKNEASSRCWDMYNRLSQVATKYCYSYCPLLKPAKGNDPKLGCYGSPDTSRGRGSCDTNMHQSTDTKTGKTRWIANAHVWVTCNCKLATPAGGVTPPPQEPDPGVAV